MAQCPDIVLTAGVFEWDGQNYVWRAGPVTLEHVCHLPRGPPDPLKEARYDAPRAPRPGSVVLAA